MEPSATGPEAGRRGTGGAGLAAMALVPQVGLPGEGGSWTGWLVVPGLTAEMQLKIVGSALLILALLFLRRGVLAVVSARVQEPALRYRWAKASGYATFVVGLLIVVQIWFSAIRSLGTFFGLLTAGLAIALKDLVADLAGWIFVLWRRPFEPGDRIQIGSHAGDVVDTRIFQFTILEIGNWVAADQSTGRIIHIPNQMVFQQPVANYTTGFPYLWNELPVLVTFESDWRKAKSMLQDIALEETRAVAEEAERALAHAARRYLIQYRNFTPAVYTSVKDSGVLLTLRYLCRPRERRGTTQALWERILDAFAAEPAVEFAYPTHRLYLDPHDTLPAFPLSERGQSQ